MNSTALDNLKKVKASILKDNKIDYDETSILLDFIYEYVKIGNKHFLKLYEGLLKAREDKIISTNESEDLICKLNAVEKILRREQIVENFLVVLGALVLIGTIVLKCVT